VYDGTLNFYAESSKCACACRGNSSCGENNLRRSSGCFKAADLEFVVLVV
jgi:hypothetical protein